MNKQVLLLILDGWGLTQNPEVSAIHKAHTPFYDKAIQQYPTAQLRTDGNFVGLPEGQMGNSEVGHMNLGAGRIVFQELERINQAVKTESLFQEPKLIEAFEYAQENNKSIHFLGLLSDGGVHSHIYHLKGLLLAAEKFGLKENLFVHAFSDGRDVDPKSGLSFVEDLQAFCSAHVGKLASLTGRYYAMDRDKRWERTKLAYDALVHGLAETTDNISAAILQNYHQGVTDEFIKPLRCMTSEASKINEEDVVIFFNFRTDRGRQLTQALTQEDFPDFGMKTLALNFVTMTRYDEKFKDISVIFEKDNLKDTLGEVLSKSGKTQIRIAETEKYPHVTFFFNGGNEVPFEGERRILCPSPKVATYDLQPEMSAAQITENILPELQKNTADFICLNFANPDMVGHTGDMQAAIKACETVDQNTQKIVRTALDAGYEILIIADHGNCECMINPDGSPNTAHTTNPVPLIYIGNQAKTINSGKLGDIAPSILYLMDIPIPKVMDGKILLS
ncbi:MAG: 2,3-bisphosphoglycerate-independent phosphoglycerate mutase [Flavobacteriaceae bacterium]|nr:2,3-bisphosphoglycerate-independent phosphoglycerate mutase [Flavobacteriaceae bacterium]